MQHHMQPALAACAGGSRVADEVPTRTFRVVIDSRDRDVRTYPTPAKYEVTLDDDLHDVRSMRIASADVPFSAYTIGTALQASVVRLDLGGGVVVPAALRPGDYKTSADLATELAHALTTAASLSPVAATFTVTPNPRTDVLEVRSDEPFTLSAPVPLAGASSGGTQTARQVARVIGMSMCDDAVAALESTSATLHDPAHPYLATLAFRTNLRPDRYMVLLMTPNAEVLISTCHAVNRGFALVPISSDSTNIQLASSAAIKTWATPLARVSRVGLTFVDYYDTPYDFQNQDHRIELEFSCDTQSYGARMYPTVL